MLEMDKSVMEEILLKLQEEGCLFPQYNFYKVNNMLCLLGKGGFSYVYEMIDVEKTDNHYAMKVIGSGHHTVTSEEFHHTIILQRFLSEQSSYVAGVLDAFELQVFLDEEGKPTGARWVTEDTANEEGILLQFVLMEKLEDILERDRFNKVTIMNDELNNETGVIKFARQIGQAIETAHDNNILHRDIKLENIFFDAKEKVYKLSDFGIAKYVEGGNAETVVYTYGYGAPEIERRLNDYYNATADIYSFGITLYLLLNDLKFPGSDGYFVNMAQYSPDFVFPAPEKASANLTHIIRKMCSYYKEDRYQSMQEVMAELNRISSDMDELEDSGKIELTDLETETYREENEVENPEGSERLPKQPTRQDRKREQQELNSYYNGACVHSVIIFSLLFALLFSGLQTDTASIGSWMFWSLPVLVFMEAVLQHMKEFHILLGIVIIVAGIVSMIPTGTYISQIVLLVCIIIGIPVITASAAVGTGLWMLLILSGKLQWLGFVKKWDISWIIIAVILFSIDKVVRLRIDLNKTTYLKAIVWTFIYDKLSLLMVLVGIVMRILQHVGVMTIPDILNRIHLIRTGSVVFIAYMIVNWMNGDLDDDTAINETIMEETDEIEDDVHLDE